MVNTFTVNTASFKPALISKGLRLLGRFGSGSTPGLQASPDFKGIKTMPGGVVGQHGRFQASPDFKGIKTSRGTGSMAAAMLQASPDFKGIKTQFRDIFDIYLRFKPALISEERRVG